MDGVVKGLIVGGVIFTAGLLIIGVSINKSAEASRDQGAAMRSCQQRQLDVMERALKQAEMAQQMQQQHMEMMQMEMMEASGETPSGFYDDDFDHMADGMPE
jgi:hypothetical protein